MPLLAVLRLALLAGVLLVVLSPVALLALLGRRAARAASRVGSRVSSTATAGPASAGSCAGAAGAVEVEDRAEVAGVVHGADGHMAKGAGWGGVGLGVAGLTRNRRVAQGLGRV